MTSKTTAAQAKDETVPPENIAALLDTAQRARRAGNIPAARALLRALSVQASQNPQVWLSLAVVAETRDEQRRALEHVLELEPANLLAQRGLARFGAARPAVQPAPTRDYTTRPLETVAAEEAVAAPVAAQEQPTSRPRVSPVLTPTSPEVAEAEHARQLRWPVYIVIGIALLILLLSARWLRPDWFGQQNTATLSTPGLPNAANGGPESGSSATALPEPVLGVATMQPELVATEAARADAVATANAVANPTPSLLPEITLVPSPTLGPTVTPLPALKIGQVVSSGVWRAVLLRPDYAVALEGGIGSLQPTGRFVLTLIAVANDGAVAAPLPSDLFAIVDGQGNRYLPLPNASTLFLDTFGRGQRGDLSLEDAIPADGGFKSVPLIFDIPTTAHDLYLVVDGEKDGWPLGQ